jgi:glycosyltransferase involved in cell wall biosynthesis
MARILIDGRWIKDSGIGRYVENLILEAVKADRDNHYIILVRKGESGCLPLDTSNIEYVETDIAWYTSQEQIALPKLIDSQKPDLVHFTNFNVPLGYRKPFVVTIHDLTLLRYKSVRGGLLAPFTYRLKDVVMRHILKTAIKRSKLIFTPSHFVAEDIVQHYKCNAAKLRVTNNAADGLGENGRVSLSKYHIKQPYMICVGNPYPHKNIEQLMKAFAKLCEDKDFYHQLVIVGRDNEFMQRHKKFAVKLGISKRIIFPGYVSDSELSGIYRKADIYAFPSLSEGFGIPGLEAMKYGVPVASSNATCLPEIFGSAAVYFDPNDVTDIARVIENLARDSKLKHQLVVRGHKQVNKYSWKKSAKVLVSGYREALKN